MTFSFSPWFIYDHRFHEFAVTWKLAFLYKQWWKKYTATLHESKYTYSWSNSTLLQVEFFKLLEYLLFLFNITALVGTVLFTDPGNSL